MSEILYSYVGDPSRNIIDVTKIGIMNAENNWA